MFFRITYILRYCFMNRHNNILHFFLLNSNKTICIFIYEYNNYIHLSSRFLSRILLDLLYLISQWQCSAVCTFYGRLNTNINENSEMLLFRSYQQNTYLPGKLKCFCRATIRHISLNKSLILCDESTYVCAIIVISFAVSVDSVCC